jgi:hypothetical protein
MSQFRPVAAGIIIGLALCAWSSAARAMDASDEPKTALGIHFQLPGSGFSNDGGMALGGLSVSLRFARFLELESGVTAMGDARGVGNATFLRMGIAPNLVLPGSDNRWSVRVPLLLGYTYLPMQAPNGEPNTTFHAVTATAGLDTTRWSLGGIGLNVRLLAYAGLANKTMTGLLDRLASHSAMQANVGLALSLGFGTRL